MPKTLWAPWRLEYIEQADELPGCIFCAAAAGEDEAHLVVRRGQHAFVLLNRYPYASGHLLVAPYRHLDVLGGLSDEEALELTSTSTSSRAGTATRASCRCSPTRR